METVGMCSVCEGQALFCETSQVSFLGRTFLPTLLKTEALSAFPAVSLLCICRCVTYAAIMANASRVLATRSLILTHFSLITTLGRYQ